MVPCRLRPLLLASLISLLLREAVAVNSASTAAATLPSLPAVGLRGHEIKPLRALSNEPITCPTSRRFYKPEENMPQTMLYSFEGSGNTWTRFLLENSTGIYTGSIYRDNDIRRAGMIGESTANNTVIAIKSHFHRAQKKEEDLAKYGKVIHLVRNPLDALVAERKRRITGSHWRNPTWEEFILGKMNVRQDNHYSFDEWLEVFAIPYYNSTQEYALMLEARPHIDYIRLRYEDLKSDVAGALGPVLEFLGYDPRLAMCPTRTQRLVSNRKKVDGWPDCLFTKRQLRRIAKAFKWSMAKNGQGIPEACVRVWDGKSKGGTDAVPVGIPAGEQVDPSSPQQRQDFFPRDTSLRASRSS